MTKVLDTNEIESPLVGLQPLSFLLSLKEEFLLPYVISWDKLARVLSHLLPGNLVKCWSSMPLPAATALKRAT